MKSTITAIVISLLLITGSYFSYSKYEDYRFIESISPIVKISSLRISDEIHVFVRNSEITERHPFLLDDESKIKLQEILEKLEMDISEIDKKILEIQSISTPKTEYKTTLVLAYLQGGQEVLRALQYKYSRTIEFYLARELSNKAINDSEKSTNYVELEDASDRAKNANETLKKFNQEWSELNSNVTKSAKIFKNLRSNVTSIITSHALVLDLDIELISG